MSNPDVRSHFPWFLYHDKTVFFDNAATTLKLAAGIERVGKYLSQESVNISRGRYPLAFSVERDIEDVRKAAAQFLRAQASEIFFTGGATDAAEKFILSLGLNIFKNNDEILYSSDDHESTVRPIFILQKLLEKQGIIIHLKPYRCFSSGEIDLRSLKDSVSDATRLIVVTHVNNKIGYVQNLKSITDILPLGCMCIVDASQSVGRISLSSCDLSRIGAIWFSGHKFFADTGVGILRVLSTVQEEIVKQGKIDAMFFEHGTLPISSILSLSASFDFIKKIGSIEIEKRIAFLQQYLVSKLVQIPGIFFAQGNNQEILQRNAGILSFGVEGVRSEVVAQALSDQYIFVRAGSLCSFNKNMNDTYADVVRVSLQLYNTIREIDYFIDCVRGLVNSVR